MYGEFRDTLFHEHKIEPVINTSTFPNTCYCYMSKFQIFTISSLFRFHLRLFTKVKLSNKFYLLYNCQTSTINKMSTIGPLASRDNAMVTAMAAKSIMYCQVVEQLRPQFRPNRSHRE